MKAHCVYKYACFAILVAFGLISSIRAQQTQPALLNTPVQYNPINSYTTATGSNTAVVTITGVGGQRVRVYSVTVWCGGAPGSGVVPGINLTDGGATIFATPGGTPTSQSLYPVGRWNWLPGLAGGVGANVVITANNGGACTQGTFLSVQADQF